MKTRLYFKLFLAGFFLASSLFSCRPAKQVSVKNVMDRVITSLYASGDSSRFADLYYDKAMDLFSAADKDILATRHWMFDVNVPAVVSVMRSARQKVVPFWLPANGFKKTGMTIKNEQTTYEVWQKTFPAGRVGLGINGVENYSLHYFVSVAPVNPNDKLKLSRFFPAHQQVGTLQNGAFTYHDWDELVLQDVPETMKGQQLLSTIRGRGTESHIVGAFRKTSYPSSAQPDQVMLTWSGNPASSMDVQWRTSSRVADGRVTYRVKGSGQTFTTPAKWDAMEDRELMNDRFIHRFTAQLKNLQPATTYEYKIDGQQDWPAAQNFTTQGNDESFSFVWFGDTHYSPLFGQLAVKAVAAHADAAFFSIAGDMVSDGLHRNQWDDLFAYTSPVISNKPLMSVLGNHDNRSGLGALMYRELFSYPKNGPKGVPPEHTYSFQYKNALFLMIDATSPIELQRPWIEAQLAKSSTRWKFAMFHFPPYNAEEPYVNIQQSWVPLFDRYQVDMVMGGHLHYYMRSKPMKAGQVADKGTTYVISVGIPAEARTLPDEPYAQVRNTTGQLYQYIKIKDGELLCETRDAHDTIVDSFTILK